MNRDDEKRLQEQQQEKKDLMEKEDFFSDKYDMDDMYDMDYTNNPRNFSEDNNMIRLQPENDFMDPIIVRDVQILGKVIGVFRFF